LAGFAGIYLLLEGLQQLGQAFAAGQVGVPGRGFLQLIGFLASDVGAFQYLQSRLLCFAAACFGFYRATAFHPYFRESYRKWLITTCWRVGRPLPLGPVTLTFSDALLVALTTALLWHAHTTVPLFAVAGLFAAVYLLRIAFSLLREGPRGGGYAVAFGLLGMLIFGSEPEFACLVAVPTYLVAWLGLRRSLARLPHYEQGQLSKLIASMNVPRGQRPAFQVASAWPFGYLAPHISAAGLPRFDATCIALLAGWTLFCLTAASNERNAGFVLPDREAAGFALLGWLLCGFSVLARLSAYCISYPPPISLFGRLATGRWIIPGYDRALVAPIGGLLIWWWLAPALSEVLHVPTAIGLSISLTLALLAVLVPGPSYRDWVLASPCRMVPTKLQ